MLNRSAPVVEAKTLLRTLNANLMDTEKKFERMEDDIMSLEAEYETAMADSKRAAAMVTDAEKMKIVNIRIRDIMPRYERVEKLRRSVTRTGVELETLNASAKEMANRLERSFARMSDIDGRLKGSADIDSKIHIEEMAVENAEAVLSKLSADRARSSACLKAEDVVRRLKNFFALHDTQARAIAAELEESKSLFLRSQIGLIAQISPGCPVPVVQLLVLSVPRSSGDRRP